MSGRGERDLAWIGHGLQAACLRFSGSGRRPEVLSAVYSPADGRLSCILAAASGDDVRELVEIALLPPARVLEVVAIVEDGGRNRPKPASPRAPPSSRSRPGS